MGVQVVMDSEMFVISLLLGVAVCLLYDFIKAKREVLKTGYRIMAIEDILFWLISGVATFWVLYRYNMGQLRYYVFLGMILGAFIYYVAFSWLAKIVFFAVFFVIFTILSLFWSLFSLPFRLLYEKNVKVLKKIHNSIRIILSNK